MKIKEQYKGIFYIILSAFCFACMNMFVRLSGDLPSIQKAFFRNFIAAVFAFIMLKRSGAPVKWQDSKNVKFLLLRALFGTIGVLGNFYAVDHLLLSDASMLNKMSPFFAVLFSFLFLKEKVTLPQGLLVAGAFLGSLFVIKPTFSNMNLLPSLIGLLGGIGAGAAYTMVRKLGELKENSAFVVLFFSVFSCLVTLPWLIFDYHAMTLAQLGLLLLAGLSAAGGQFAITSAYFHAPAREISVYDYSQILFSAALGFIMFGQIPDLLSWIGYAIICGMAVLMFLYNRIGDGGK